jgi:hypothetical protein
MAERKPHYASLGYRFDRKPGTLSEATRLLERMLAAARGKGCHLRGVELVWRNNPGDHLRHDEFCNALRESRSGFARLVERRIERDLHRLKKLKLRRRVLRRASRKKKRAGPARRRRR